MKKQILTLTMCLALTATSALAAGTNAVTQKAVSQVKTAATTTVKPAPAPSVAKPEPPKMMTREEAKKHFEERRAQERERMYNALKLSAEQKAKAEALDAKTKQDVEPLIKKAQLEGKKLRELKAKKASSFETWKQEYTYKAAKNDVKKYFDSSRKSFEAILTKEQRAKYQEMDRFRKAHRPGGPKGMGHRPQGPGPEHMGPPPEDKK
ncbi:MAG: hypothetical protein WCY19_01875 [Candidatus Gastranaerophilaceae bacterium]